MFRKSLLTVFSLLMALLVGVAGVGAAGKGSTTPAPSGQTTGTSTTPQAATGSGFTYQGRLTSGGNAANGNYDLNFTLWDAASGGNQTGPIVGTNNLTVNNGLFTVSLDFGPSAFQGSARWLEIQVRQAGGGSFTTLAPRQPLTAAPYAMSLMPGAVVTGTVGGPLLFLGNTNGLGLRVEGTSSAVPGLYAQNNDPFGMGIEGLSGNSSGVHGLSSNGNGVWGQSTSGTGVRGTSTSGAGGYFTSTSYIAVRGDSNSNVNSAVYGLNNGSGPGVMGQQNSGGTAVYGLASTGYGVSGISTSSTGVSGSSTAGYGVSGYSSSNIGVYGSSGGNTGVYGSSSGSNGVAGSSNSGYGVYGSSNNVGVYGEGNSGTAIKGHNNGSSPTIYGENSGTGPGTIAIEGKSDSNTGIYGLTDTGWGVVGIASSSGTSGYGVSGTSFGYGGSTAGVYGEGKGLNASGVIGEADNGSLAYGVWGKSAHGFAGWFSGDVHVSGTLSKSAGSFQIDDPIDPANKYLSHSFVESPDMMNIYNGNITTDARGEATVTMPAWFQDLNQDFRYQLTTIGGFAPVYISQEIQGNQFKIAGGKPGIKVSWQVTGIRHDPYASAHRIPVEQDKPANERGYYLNPDVYGQPASKSMENSRPGAQSSPASIPTGK